MMPVNLNNFIIRMANLINIPLQGFSLYRKARVSALVSADASIRVFFLLILRTLLLSIRRGFQGYGNNLVSPMRESLQKRRALKKRPTPVIQRGHIYWIWDRGSWGAHPARVWLFWEVKNKHREETRARAIPRPFLSIRPLRSLPFPLPSFFSPHPTLCLSPMRSRG